MITPAHAHGTWRGYRYYGCRCPACRAFRAEQNRIERDRRMTRDQPPRIHGTYNGYTNYSCVCQPCLDAGSEWNRAYAQRRKSHG